MIRSMFGTIAGGVYGCFMWTGDGITMDYTRCGSGTITRIVARKFEMKLMNNRETQAIFPELQGIPLVQCTLLMRQCWEFPAVQFSLFLFSDRVIIKPWDVSRPSSSDSAHTMIFNNQFVPAQICQTFTPLGRLSKLLNEMFGATCS